MISRFNPPLLDVLPCVPFLDYTAKDLGIDMNRSQSFTEHTDFLYSRANQRLGLLKRSCHFVHRTPKRRILYLTMVRSIFEHCPVVLSDSAVCKLESIQKLAVKWINKGLPDNCAPIKQIIDRVPWENQVSHPIRKYP